MGTGAFWVPALISAVGAGAGAYETRRVAKKQDALAAEGIRQQSMRQREADARISQELGALERSSPEAERAKALDDYVAQLRATRANAAGGGAVPGASDRYQTDEAGARADIQNFGEKVAGTLARINAPGFQRQREGFGINRLGGDIGGISRAAQGDDFLTQLRLSRVGRNPWVDAAAQGLQGLGQGMAGRAAAPASAARRPLMQQPGGFDPAIYG